MLSHMVLTQLYAYIYKIHKRERERNNILFFVFGMLCLLTYENILIIVTSILCILLIATVLTAVVLTPEVLFSKFHHNKYNIYFQRCEIICKCIVAHDPVFIKFMENKYKTKEISMIVVEICGKLLEYVEEQDEEICMLAIMQDPDALAYVKHQNKKLCKSAIDLNPFTIEFVKEQTEELCILAITKDPFTIRHIKERNEKICRLAYEKNKKTIVYMDDKLKYIFIPRDSNDFRNLNEIELQKIFKNKFIKNKNFVEICCICNENTNMMLNLKCKNVFNHCYCTDCYFEWYSKNKKTCVQCTNKFEVENIFLICSA
ncbi:hypothetical protein BMW23_1033 [Bodo saltans virus]|uniref:DUF4116 domain-containing protein n=1 Tax=Bodo saltans virus TaxID=2024608 RepID=A0A2H4UVW3_9VIRU|nr:hypothetical protein QJ851_gp1015 [Bodo saltans virus]ATZ81078.1 hypothetical protein BMW23_1033 [Bodo saltans virus]